LDTLLAASSPILDDLGAYMKPGLLYKVFLIGLAILFAVTFLLMKVDRNFLPHAEVSDSSPKSSALTEVEFETGDIVKKLNAVQETRLHTYRGDPKIQAFVEVPIDRAIDEYLKEKP
jgi:hypothetical protein